MLRETQKPFARPTKSGVEEMKFFSNDSFQYSFVLEQTAFSAPTHRPFFQQIFFLHLRIKLVRFLIMPRSGERAKKRRNDSGRSKKRSRDRRRSGSSECKKSCGAAVLKFCAGTLTSPECTKRFLNVDTYLPNSSFIGYASDTFPTGRDELYSAEATLPVDATSMVVTWNFTEVNPPVDDLTRYIISIERDLGCNISPIVKLRVPVSHVPKNDCEQTEKSQLSGCTQPFRVSLCAGDSILVGITSTIADQCPVQCGIVGGPITQQNVTVLKSVRVRLYMF
jgi:hypothetical protein